MIPAHKQYTQFELFPTSRQEPAPRTRQALFLEKITLRLEHLVVFSMVVIIIMVLSFSFGVEKGKRIVFKKTAVPLLTSPSIAESETPGVKEEVVSESIQKAEVVNPKESKATPGAGLPESIPALESEDTPSEKSVDNVYTVQVASFKTGTYAEKEAMNLKDKGYEILVIPKGKHSIVCVGKFALEHQAKDFSHKLKKQYKDCLVRRL